MLGVFLAGILLGPLWGAGAMGLYLIAGAVGAPVFAMGSAGLGVLLGPTGGYLLSYPIAAAVVGLIVHRGLDVRDYRAVGLPLLVGAMVALGHAEGVLEQIIGFIAVFLAAGNAVGGYFVTERMLGMFKTSGDQQTSTNQGRRA